MPSCAARIAATYPPGPEPITMQSKLRVAIDASLYDVALRDASPMADDDALDVGRGIRIPLAEIELRTARSGGPGGQHANVTESRVTAVFDVLASRALADADRELVR